MICSQSAKSEAFCATPELSLTDARVSMTRSIVVLSISGAVMAARMDVRMSMSLAKTPKTARLTLGCMRKSTVNLTAAGGSAEGEGEGVVVAVGLVVADEEREDIAEEEAVAETEVDADTEATPETLAESDPEALGVALREGHEAVALPDVEGDLDVEAEPVVETVAVADREGHEAVALSEGRDESEAETEGETDGEPLCETVAVALGAAEREGRAEAVTDTEPLAVLEAELE